MQRNEMKVEKKSKIDTYRGIFGFRRTSGETDQIRILGRGPIVLGKANLEIQVEHRAPKSTAAIHALDGSVS